MINKDAGEFNPPKLKMLSIDSSPKENATVSFSLNHPISMLQNHQQDFQARMNATYTNAMQQNQKNYKNKVSLTIHEDFSNTGMKIEKKDKLIKTLRKE